MNKHLSIGLTALAVCVAPPDVNAAIIEVDGTNIATLSAAVNQAKTTPDGPHTINITAANITDNAPVYITEAITINGDPNGTGNKADILVDIPALRAAAPPSAAAPDNRAYIVIETTGVVEISDLKIHPNEDGTDDIDNDALKVDAARLLKPAAEGNGEYNFRRVFISGSDENNEYISLETGDNIYDTAAKKWSGGNTANAVIQMSNQRAAGGTGTYGVLLKDCHVGLGKGPGINSPVTGGNARRIEGGLYGHVGRDGISVSGTQVQIVGTPDNRVRIVRPASIGGLNAHGLEIRAGGRIAQLYYTDVATWKSANALKAEGGDSRFVDIQHLRVLGKHLTPEEPGINAAVYLQNTIRLTMTNSTVHGSGSHPTPLESHNSNFGGQVAIEQSIFTSQFGGQMHTHRTGTEIPYSVKDGAVAIDGTANESLQLAAPIVGNNSDGIFTNNINESPNYQLTLDDYDWTDRQGADNPLNGPGNNNVLRPTNPAYLTAGPGGTPLYGGAGPSLASIAPEVWMLME